MKKFTKVFISLFALILVLAACGNNNTEDVNTNNAGNDNGTNAANETAASEFEPEAINPEKDICEVCAMAVNDDQHATQIILKNDRSLKFDDIGCLYSWLDENGEEDVGAQYVRDFHTKEWVLMEDATYVFDEEIETPMAYGVISFKDEEEAATYMEEHDLGKMLKVEELQDHKWEMMDHDHGDHDHDDHGNHDEHNETNHE